MKQKVYRKKSAEKRTNTETLVVGKAPAEHKKPNQTAISPKRNTYLGWTLFGVTILAFVILWARPLTPKVEDPWLSAAMMVNKAAETKQPEEKKKLLNEAHTRFQDLTGKHPYHARLWYIYGFYFMQTQEWDSVIACNKKAIELGKGGTVNQVEFSAADNLAYGLSMKLNDPALKQQAPVLLKNAEVNGFVNLPLIRLQGVYYTNLNKPDSALHYLKQAATLEKNADVLYNIAINFYNKQQMDSAVHYLHRALEVKKDHGAASQLLQQISTRAK